MISQVKVLCKTKRGKPSQEELLEDESRLESQPNIDLSVFKLKHESDAKTFKLIDDREWNIIASEPHSEATFFADGHSAMSIISVIGSKGVGKSSLLNKIAKKDAFKTYKTSNSAISVNHITRGVDIHATHHRMLLDCQPLNAASVLDEFITGRCGSQFPKNSQISDAFTSCHMISLQLATFLFATCDYVVISTKWLIDIHLLKLIATAIMMIGEDNLRVKLVIYSDDIRIHQPKFKQIVDASLGKNRVDRYFDKESELIEYISAYSSEKCDAYQKDPSTFTGRNWLDSCQRIWNQNIKNSPMFNEYALQLAMTNN